MPSSEASNFYSPGRIKLGLGIRKIQPRKLAVERPGGGVVGTRCFFGSSKEAEIRLAVLGADHRAPLSARSNERDAFEPTRVTSIRRAIVLVLARGRKAQVA